MRVLAILSLLLLTGCGTVGNALIGAAAATIAVYLVEHDR